MIQCSASSRFLRFSLLASLAVGFVFRISAADKPGGVVIKDEGDKLRIEVGGRLFSEYHYKNVTRPYFYPIIGAGGAQMARNWPQKDVPGEEHDHKHHHALWYAHGSINGVDFWSEEKNFGTTVHEKFTEIKPGSDVGVIKAQQKLLAHDGSIVATGEQTIRIYNRPETPTMDYDITIHASNGKVVFGDTKEGAMAIRLAESMRLAQPKGKPPGQGHIVNSEGIRDGNTWGKRARWCDYYGPVDGKIVGLAIFDHPQNPRHPTWWHVRDYGLFAANAFGQHDFERLPDKNAGNLEVPAGRSVTFRYRFYFHEGDEKQGKVAEHYDEYSRPSVAK